ncbi:hypothetical protein [Dyadobacter frigoris]|uniref:Uncharacterized protein n=1 Tax=Dyadobacter frigoris TaxID=2576211 RepID=A0A4U6DCQ2_9BACT|nr:hypothetical protein [Dyadobacter frigoris]TKT94147.1 hypothetical protein FDK13_02745 [Dyadobacter frigoris]
MEEEILQAKQAFLQDYNIPGTVIMALTKAINASVQHNHTYHQNCAGELREPIREFWKGRLIALSGKYIDKQKVATYEHDILSLKEVMDENFGPSFCEGGFKISHAQKSISVFLKHLWCLGAIVTPPQCPVDRIILAHVGHGNVRPSWTKVNTIEEHRAHVALLEAHRALTPHLALAEWELLAFANVGN